MRMATGGLFFLGATLLSGRVNWLDSHVSAVHNTQDMPTVLESFADMAHCRRQPSRHKYAVVLCLTVCSSKS